MPMRTLLAGLRARPQLLGSITLGVVAGTLSPGDWHVVTRCLVGWNVGVWLYLALIGWMMWRADHAHLQRAARAHAEGAGTVLAIVVLATLMSLGAIAVELSAAKAGGTRYALPHVLFALATVAGSWLLLATLFTLDYASLYYHRAGNGKGGGTGLTFPGAAPDFRPGYADFAYVSFTIAVALQTSDVSISAPLIRRVVLVQSVLSFAFNTLILALTVNIAAGLL
jgi:uncharacterized membrane protein